ncbi:MAG: iron-containing alcohol dehydrogenase [Halieaceae bacterium]
MFLRRLKHNAFISFAGFLLKFSPGVSYLTFAGEGSSRALCRHIARSGARKVLVVTDKPLRELGVVDQAIAGLAEQAVPTVVFDGVLPDPTYQVVAEGKAVYEAQDCDCILAIGGGSSIDAAKVIGLALTHEGDPADYVGFGKVKEELPPLYVIPTTSGTGSEATMGAVISDNETHEKGILSGGTMLPRAACLDASLMTGLPPHITAATGMDALTHAIEAYIGVWDRGDSLEKAATATKLIFANLEKAYSNGADLAARDAMAEAAYLAGQAINQVNVGNVHAIAHQMGALYGVPHGLANAQVMPHVLDMSKERAGSRLAELAQLIGLQTADEFIGEVRRLTVAVGIPEKVDALQLEDYDTIIERAIVEGDGYPVPHMMSQLDVRLILNNLM